MEGEEADGEIFPRSVPAFSLIFLRCSSSDGGLKARGGGRTGSWERERGKERERDRGEKKMGLTKASSRSRSLQTLGSTLPPVRRERGEEGGREGGNIVSSTLLQPIPSLSFSGARGMGFRVKPSP